MTTNEVISAIISYPEGTKFSHPYFSKDEYIINKNGHIYTEDGYEVNDEFWSIRKDWTDWYICDDTQMPAIERKQAQVPMQKYAMPKLSGYCPLQERSRSPKEYGQSLMNNRKRKKK